MSRAVLRAKNIEGPEDPLTCQLLQFASLPNTWREWFSNQGLAERAVELGPQFDLISVLIQARCAGMGIGLVARVLVEDELEVGALVVPGNVYEPSRVGPLSSDPYPPRALSASHGIPRLALVGATSGIVTCMSCSRQGRHDRNA